MYLIHIHKIKVVQFSSKKLNNQTRIIPIHNNSISIFKTMLFINVFKYITIAVFAVYVCIYIFGTIMYITNLIYTIDYLQKTLYSAEKNIEQIRGQLSEIRKHIQDKNIETTKNINDIRKHLQDVDDAIEGQTVDQINEIYECLDVLDDRLLEVVKIVKKKETKK